MPEFLRQSLASGPSFTAAEVLTRLVAAFLLGVVVAYTYRRTRPETAVVPSFPTTLVLLAILIAMVTQVIGDNVARAFSLVGALSIVRFRTVVRDTQDTAYVIFAVGVGMAVGAGQLAVAVAGIGVVAVAAVAMRPKPAATSSGLDPGPVFALQVRVGIGHDPHTLLGPILDQHVRDRQLVEIATVRQGVAVDVRYRTTLAREADAESLLRVLNRLEGVQSVTLSRIGPEDEAAAGRAI